MGREFKSLHRHMMEWYVCTWYESPELQKQDKSHVLVVKAKSLADAHGCFPRIQGVTKTAVLDEIIRATPDDVVAIQGHLQLHQQRTGTSTRDFWFYHVA